MDPHTRSEALKDIENDCVESTKDGVFMGESTSTKLPSVGFGIPNHVTALSDIIGKRILVQFVILDDQGGVISMKENVGRDDLPQAKSSLLFTKTPTHPSHWQLYHEKTVAPIPPNAQPAPPPSLAESWCYSNRRQLQNSGSQNCDLAT